jgi:hypothetical protein
MLLDLEWKILKARFVEHREQASALREISAQLLARARLMRLQNQLAAQRHAGKTEQALRSFGNLPDNS